MKPKRRGRPLGGKNDPAVRLYWRNLQSNYRARMNRAANRDLKQAGRVP